MPRKIIYRSFIFLALLFSFHTNLNAQKQKVTVSKYTDTIVLKNNDRVIGEIKKMENGVASIKTDYSDSDFELKWVHINEINTGQAFLIILSDGKRYNSHLKKSLTPGKVLLDHGEVEVSVDISSIVFLKPVEESFFSRFTGSVSVGFNYTKSDNLKQFTVRSNLDYTNRYLTFSAAYNLVTSSQDNAENIKRTDGNAGIRYFLKKDHFLILSSNFLSNTEQKLNLRLATKFGYGKYFVHNNRTYFGGALGLVWNNENFSDIDNTNQNSLEAFGSLELNMFDIKDFSLLTNLAIYPSLTESGRIRSDFSLDLKYDLPLDFFIKLGGTYNFDNKPVEGASKDDYVIQATFGWEKN